MMWPYQSVSTNVVLMRATLDQHIPVAAASPPTKHTGAASPEDANGTAHAALAVAWLGRLWCLAEMQAALARTGDHPCAGTTHAALHAAVPPAHLTQLLTSLARSLPALHTAAGCVARRVCSNSDPHQTGTRASPPRPHCTPTAGLKAGRVG